MIIQNLGGGGGGGKRGVLWNCASSELELGLGSTEGLG